MEGLGVNVHMDLDVGVALDLDSEAVGFFNVYQLDSLNISYHSQPRQEPILASLPYCRLAPWRMNLVAVSERLSRQQDHLLLFIAVERRIHVKPVSSWSGSERGLAAVILEMPTPPMDYLASLESDDQEESPFDTHRLINYLTVGRIGQEQFLAVADEVGQVAVWNVASVSRGPVQVIRTGSSVWSLSFSAQYLLVGCNRHEVLLYELPSGLLLFRHPHRHQHNIPSLHLLSRTRSTSATSFFEIASVSIDGTFLYTEIEGSSKTIRSQEVSLEQWGWTVVRIAVPELERECDYGQIQQSFRCKQSPLYNPRGQRQDRRALVHDPYYDAPVLDDFYSYQDSYSVELDVEPDWFPIEEEAELSSDVMGEGTSHPTDPHPGHLFHALNEDRWPSTDTFSSTDRGSQSEVESDTAYLNRTRRQQASDPLETGLFCHPADEEDDNWEGEESRSRQPRFIVTSDLSLSPEHDTLYAVTSISELFLITKDGVVLLRLPLPALHPTPPSPLMPNNRYNMAQWIPPLSLLIVGNQAGQLLLLHLVTSMTGHLNAQVAVVPRRMDALLAGFVAHPLGEGDRVWNLYILFLDGTFLDVRIERCLQGILSLPSL